MGRARDDPAYLAGQRAEVVVVAPATARFIAAYATGLSNGLLTATVLAAPAPVVVCPAMHTEMWEHPAVQENVATLRRRGVHIVWPEEGGLPAAIQVLDGSPIPRRSWAQSRRCSSVRDAPAEPVTWPGCGCS